MLWSLARNISQQGGKLQLPQASACHSRGRRLESPLSSKQLPGECTYSSSSFPRPIEVFIMTYTWMWSRDFLGYSTRCVLLSPPEMTDLFLVVKVLASHVPSACKGLGWAEQCFISEFSSSILFSTSQVGQKPSVEVIACQTRAIISTLWKERETGSTAEAGRLNDAAF